MLLRHGVSRGGCDGRSQNRPKRLSCAGEGASQTDGRESVYDARGGGDRSALLSEITQLVELIKPVVSHDKYFHTHTELALIMVSADDPMSALDHIVALLARCGAVRTQRPPL